MLKNNFSFINCWNYRIIHYRLITAAILYMLSVTHHKEVFKGFGDLSLLYINCPLFSQG